MIRRTVMRADTRGPPQININIIYGPGVRTSAHVSSYRLELNRLVCPVIQYERRI